QFGPVGPDGHDRVGQRRQAAEFDPALARRVEVGAARRKETEVARMPGELAELARRMRTAEHLDADAADIAELRHQRPQPARVDAVAAGMREHRGAAGIADPAHGLVERGPAMRDVTRLALDEEAAEDL